jgi:hypothetical protein
VNLWKRLEKLERRGPGACVPLFPQLSDEHLARCIARAAPADLGLTAEQVDALPDDEVLRLVDESLLQENRA